MQSRKRKMQSDFMYGKRRAFEKERWLSSCPCLDFHSWFRRPSSVSLLRFDSIIIFSYVENESELIIRSVFNLIHSKAQIRLIRSEYGRFNASQSLVSLHRVDDPCIAAHHPKYVPISITPSHSENLIHFSACVSSHFSLKFGSLQSSHSALSLEWLSNRVACSTQLRSH